MDDILFIDEDQTVVASQKSKWTNANAFKDQKRPTMRASKQFISEAMDMLSRCNRQVAAATHLQEDHILTTLEEAVSNEGVSQVQPSNCTLDIEGDDLVIGVSSTST